MLTLRPKVVYYLATTYMAWPFLAARQFICFVLRHQILHLIGLIRRRGAYFMPLPAQDSCYDSFFCFMPCWHRTGGHADKVHSWLECYEGFSLVAPTLITEMLVNCSFTKYGSPLRHLWSTLSLRISTPSRLTLSAVAPST